MSCDGITWVFISSSDLKYPFTLFTSGLRCRAPMFVTRALSSITMEVSSINTESGRLSDGNVIKSGNQNRNEMRWYEIRWARCCWRCILTATCSKQSLSKFVMLSCSSNQIHVYPRMCRSECFFFQGRCNLSHDTEVVMCKLILLFLLVPRVVLVMFHLRSRTSCVTKSRERSN